MKILIKNNEVDSFLGKYRRLGFLSFFFKLLWGEIRKSVLPLFNLHLLIK